MVAKSKQEAIQEQVAAFIDRVNQDLMTVTEMKTVYCSAKLGLQDEVWQEVEASERAVDDILHGNKDTEAEGILTLIGNYQPKSIPKIKKMMTTYDTNMKTLMGLVTKHCKEPFEAMGLSTTEDRMENILKKDSSESIKWVKWNFDSLASLEKFMRKVTKPGIKLLSSYWKHLMGCLLLFLLIVTKYQSFKMFFGEDVYSQFRGLVTGFVALSNVPTNNSETNVPPLLLIGNGDPSSMGPTPWAIVSRIKKTTAKSLTVSIIKHLVLVSKIWTYTEPVLQEFRKWWKNTEPKISIVLTGDSTSVKDLVNITLPGDTCPPYNPFIANSVTHWPKMGSLDTACKISPGFPPYQGQLALLMSIFPLVWVGLRKTFKPKM